MTTSTQPEFGEYPHVQFLKRAVHKAIDAGFDLRQDAAHFVKAHASDLATLQETRGYTYTAEQIDWMIDDAISGTAGCYGVDLTDIVIARDGTIVRQETAKSDLVAMMGTVVVDDRDILLTHYANDLHETHVSVEDTDYDVWRIMVGDWLEGDLDLIKRRGLRVYGINRGETKTWTRENYR